MINFSASSLFAGLIFGVIGLYLFRRGKKELNHSVMFIGLVLMIYPYFTSGPLADWGVGIALTAAAWYLW